MSNSRMAVLDRRGVLAVGGPEAKNFLDGLLTVDVDAAAPGAAVFAGLLSPQGKVLFDFIVFSDGERYLLDMARDQIPAAVQRLTLFRLRAKVTFDDVSDTYDVVAVWGDGAADIPVDLAAADPRLAALGGRVLVTETDGAVPGFTASDAADYDRHRIALGVPEGGIDYAFGAVFPHDVDMDQLHGVDFDKGCFVGQEVVSRMKHRGTARRRIIMVAGAPLPASGTDLTADGRAIGTLASTAGDTGLVMVRLDRAKEAMDAGTAILTDTTPVTLTIPPWATFAWPGADAAE
ncbi:YgfZ/GcvT domain-containing protein [Bauldia sp.]|uniref:CAF17-like 4Fe-4S cluster assembly/insertion protein YgfZ n=1 Tax=Bauldia sp. TaxID=2575872 RepID=UPI003BA9F8CF